MATTVIALAALFFFGHALNWFFIKTKIPDLLILIAVGYILGPVTNIVEASDLGAVGAVVSTVALIVILYEGGLHLNTRDLAISSLPAAGISLAGFALITISTTLIAYLFAFESWPLAILLGVGIGSTSSAIVIPMVKHLSISDNTKTVLSLESAFTDVLTIVIFLVLTDSMVSGQFSIRELLMGIGPKTLTATSFGLIAGVMWAYIKAKFSEWIPAAFANEAWAILAYGLIEFSGHNGAIGVLALGFMEANLKLLPDWMRNNISSEPITDNEIGLLKEITFLLRTFFFIYLGTLVSFASFGIFALALVLTIAVFATRYLAVRTLLSPKKVSRLDAMVATAMGPRGLACAVLATVPLNRGLEGGQWLQSVMFAVVPLTILFTAIFVSISEKDFFRRRMDFLFGTYTDQDRLALTKPSADTQLE